FLVDSVTNISGSFFWNNDEARGNEQSVFLNSEIDFIKNLKIGAGLRWSTFSLAHLNRKFLEPRLHFSYLLGNRLSIHGHYGEFHQNLNRRNLETPFQVDNGFWYLSDEGITSDDQWIYIVENTQRSLGLKYHINNWTFNLEAYSKEIANMWTAALDFSIQEDPYTFASMSVKGIEFSTQYRNKKFSLLWTYDYIDENLDLHWSEEDLKSPFTQPHRISLFQSYQFGKFIASVHWRYATGRLFSTEPELTTRRDQNNEEYFVIEHGNILSQRVPANHSLDVSLLYRFENLFGIPAKGKLGFHIINLYDRRNIIKNQYYVSYRTNPVSVGLLEKQDLPLTANFSFHLNF
ncbi:MAG: TonB-dependent receptor, partial [Bacteroidota bacterium]